MQKNNAQTPAPQAIVDGNPDLKGLPFQMRVLVHILKRITWGSLSVIVPDGRRFEFRGATPGRHGIIHIYDFSVLNKLKRQGTLGAGEAFFEGLWDSPDVTALLEVIVRNEESFDEIFSAGKILRPFQRFYHYLKRNTKEGSKRNIMAHYDLGNDFYAQWLDSSMTYSSALFDDRSPDLQSAQENKYRSLANRLDLQPHHTVLEIGCGWGGFAEYAAREIGCTITGITISPEQHKYACNRIKAAGLNDKVTIQLQDYRDCEGEYDRIVSIEMLEAVGLEYWPAYFQTLKARLKPGGRAGIQVITIEEKSFEFYKTKMDFIQRYIFPGGMLPAASALRSEVAQAGLRWADNITFGKSYGQTLEMWRERFLNAWPTIHSLGFDKRFRRLWTYYLCYCEAGFRAGSIDVTQITVEKP